MIAGLAVVALLAAEAIAFYTVGELLAATYPDERSTQAVSPFILLTLSLVAFSLPRVVPAVLPRGRPANIAIGAATFVAVYGAFRIEFAGDFALWDFTWVVDFVAGRGIEVVELPRPITGAALIAFAWARATWRSLTDVEFESTPRQLAGPAGIVIVASILGAASTHDDLIARGAVVFFAVALVALAFSQSALSGVTFGDLRAGGVTSTLMIGSAAAAVLGVLVFGVLFRIFGGPLADGLVSAIQLILLVTVGPLVAGAEWFVGLFNFDAGVFTPRDVFGNVEEPPEDEVDQRSTVERSFLALIRAVGLGAGLVFLVGIILLFAGRWRRYRRTSEQAVLVSSSGSLREDLGSLLGNLFHRNHGAESAESTDRVVRLYHRILRVAHDLGHDRLPGQTPHEFAPELRRAFAHPIVDDVTVALEADVYGSRSLPLSAVEELESRWEERRA